MTHSLVLPIVIPLGASIAAFVGWRHLRVQRAASLTGASGLLLTGLWLIARTSRDGVLVAHVGNWPAPFGITLVADVFSALMVTVSGIIATAVVIYSFVDIDEELERHGYHAFLQAMLAGVAGAFLAGDVFNLYVWFEVLLIASFVLLALGGERAQIDGAITYVTLNLVASALLLAAVGILYGATGTLNMAQLADLLSRSGDTVPAAPVAMLFLVAFGIKAAVFPLFFWLPVSYHTPPVAVSAVFAGLLTKVGVYALIRMFTLVFGAGTGAPSGLLLALSGATMITGVLGALAQQEFRRVLSFHIVSQIGYMIMGLALFTPAALAASIFYVIHHILVKTNLFLIAGFVLRLQGTLNLRPLGGLYRSRPLYGLLFLVPAFSLAGAPPFSGFFGKLALLQASMAVESYLIAAVAVVVSLLTLMSMTKLWNEAFWKAPTVERVAETLHPTRLGRTALLAPSISLAALTLVISFGAGPTLALAERAADQLLDRESYVRAVLGVEMGGEP